MVYLLTPLFALALFLYCVEEFGKWDEREWFAWRPVRDEDGNWIWWRYVDRRADGRIVRLPTDVDY